MTHFSRTIAATLGAAALALGLGLGAAPVAAAGPASTSGPAKVEVGDNFFKPEELVVMVGTKVTWKNQGKVLHNVTAVKGKFGTKALTKGKTYSYRFKKPGTYAYYCTFHGSPTGGQRGTVKVVAPAPATTTPTTTTS
jgi:plastocyanin